MAPMLAALALAIMAVTFFLLIPWLAEVNLLFTTVKEGTVKVVLRGESMDRILMSFRGYHLNKPGSSQYRTQNPSTGEVAPDWQIYNHEANNTNGFSDHNDDHYDDRWRVFKMLGVHWIGWPWLNVDVYEYDFAWNEMRKNDKGADEIWVRAAPTNFAFVSDFTYAIVTENAETAERLPTRLLTLVTVAIRNPELALFRGENWLVRLTAAVNRTAREYVGSQKYADIITDSSQYALRIKTLTDLLPDDSTARTGQKGLKGRYGIEIRAVDLQEFDLSGDAKDANQAAATALYTAEQKAKAQEKTADAEAYTIRKKSEAEADGIAAKVKAVTDGGEDGRLVAQLQALISTGENGNTVIFGGSPLEAAASKFLRGDKK